MCRAMSTRNAMPRSPHSFISIQFNFSGEFFLQPANARWTQFLFFDFLSFFFCFFVARKCHRASEADESSSAAGNIQNDFKIKFNCCGEYDWCNQTTGQRADEKSHSKLVNDIEVVFSPLFIRSFVRLVIVLFFCCLALPSPHCDRWGQCLPI